MHSFTMNHNFSLFRNNFYDIPLIVLDNELDPEYHGTQQIEISFDSEIWVYEYHSYFFYSLICILSLKLFRCNLIGHHHYSIPIYHFSLETWTTKYSVSNPKVSIVGYLQ